MMPSEEVYGTEELRQSPFVEKVMPDPTHPRSVAPWLGLVGKSTEDGYWRLYLTIQLESYIEFKEESVLAFDIIPADNSPLEVEAARVYLEPSSYKARTHALLGGRSSARPRSMGRSRPTWRCYCTTANWRRILR